jgi:predicted enzyme related to lactoylglutathione lyase
MFGSLDSPMSYEVNHRQSEAIVDKPTMDLLINIDVDDLAKAITFYEQAIGLQVSRRFGSFGVEIVGASSPVYLLMKQGGTKPSVATEEVRRYSRHWTPVHVDFVVPDIEAAVARAKKAGAVCEYDIQTPVGAASRTWLILSAKASA